MTGRPAVRPVPARRRDPRAARSTARSAARLERLRRARVTTARRAALLRHPVGSPAAATPAADDRSAPGLAGAVAAQASLVAAVMFYLGAVYLTAFYHYFRLDVFTLGIGFPELAIQALNLVRRPVVIALTVMGYAALRPDLLSGRAWPGPVARFVRRAGVWARSADLLLVPSGLLALVLWRWTHPYGWAAALALALGVALAHRRAAARRDGPAATAAGRAAAASVTGLLVLWAVTLAADGLGVAEARLTGRHVVSRTAVVVLTTDRLSLAGPGVRVEDLGKDTHFRYRYTGLRRLIERGGRYYLLPLGWTPETGTTYVIDVRDGVRVELAPGTLGQP
ncbi:hypothetical protein ACF068_07015 [Streptomyces sp. NPDC016309]|uniref:hypothetical protein n=1 Tax=Streptomyces sp. NPDC016309 TaxID=3364965 RepID=UPI0036FDCCFF